VTATATVSFIHSDPATARLAREAAFAASEAAAAAEIAADAAASAAVRRPTLADLQAVTTSPTGALGEVYAETANNGSYRWDGAAWTLVSRATLPFLGNTVSTLPRHGPAGVVPLTFVNSAGDRWSPIWLTSGQQVDLVPSTSLITKITASLSPAVAASTVVTSKFSIGTRRHGVNVPFAITCTPTGGMSWAPFWVDAVGRVDLIPSDSLLRRLGAAASAPSGVFTGSVSTTPLLQYLSSTDEGWPQRYSLRADLTAPTTAVAVSRERALLFTMTGQSNSAGGGATDFPEGSRAVTTTPPYRHRAVTMTGGPIFSSLSAIDQATVTDLIPCREIAAGESPVSSALRWSSAKDLAAGVAPLIRIGETHGFAGQKLAEISKGTGPYTNGLMLWQRAAQLAANYGLPGIWAPAFHMDQGEADRTSTSRASYVATGATFRADHEADIRAITRQAEPVWWAMIQLAATPGDLANAWTALFQHDLMVGQPRTTLVCPSYFFQGSYGMSGVHFTPTGHALRGEYHAKANRIIRRAVENAVNTGADPWALTIANVRTCLRPDLPNVTRSGAVITIPLILPEDGTSVVLDTTTLPAAVDYGFVKTAGSGGAISSVALVGNSIEVTLASAGGATLQYAYATDAVGGAATTDRSGGWGNFRDNCNEDSIAVSGLKLRNWLVTFDVVVP
jgi:hypothetical protein